MTAKKKGAPKSMERRRKVTRNRSLSRSRFFALRKPRNWPRLGSQRKLRLSRCNGRSGGRRRRRFFRKRLSFHQEFELGGIEHFPIQQRACYALQRFAIGFENILGLGVTVVDDVANFTINLDRSVFGIIAVLRDFAAQEDGFFLLAEGLKKAKGGPVEKPLRDFDLD